MSDPRDELEVWEALMDKHALGEVFSAEDEAFCKRFVSEHPECQCELDVYTELGELDSRPDPATRTLVDAALKRMELDEAERTVEEAHAFRKRRPPLFAIATGVLAVAAAFAVYFRPASLPQDSELRSAQVFPPARAELVYASGTVSVAGAAARVGKTALAEGSSIETGEGSACVLIDPDINVCLSQHTRLTLAALATGARRLELGTGRAAVRLATQPEGMSLSIVAGDVVSTAVGTAFSVERAAQGGAVVTTVLNGKVRVGREQKEARLVAAHERSEVSAAHSELTSVSRAEEAPAWALLGPTILWHDPVAATLELRGEVLHAEAWLDDQPLGIAPLSTLIPVGTHRLLVRANGEVLFDADVRMNAGDSQVIEYRAQPKALAPAIAALDAAKAAPRLQKSIDANAKLLTAEELQAPTEVAAPESAAQLLGLARKLIRAQRFADAAKTYADIRKSYASSEEAHTVLVLLGQLELTQLKDPARALGDLESYLAQGGALAEEARGARIRALRALHRDADEAAAIEEFLVKHPRSFEAAGLRARLSILRPSH